MLAAACAGALFGQVNSGRIIQTYAGTDFTFQSEGQPAIDAPLGSPADLDIDAAGNLYIGVEFYQAFRVTTGGDIHLIAGTDSPLAM